MLNSPECIRIIDPYEREKWFQNWHSLIQSIIKYTDIISFNENEELFLLLNEDLKKNQILWYPSSGFDVTDIINVNNEMFPEFEFNNPDIFIHNDLLFDVYQFRNQIIENKIYIIKEICLAINHQNNSKELNLFYISTKGKSKWVIYFSKLANEQLLKLFLEYSVKIKFIYSVCDGIWHGMGGGYPNAVTIPTKFYSFFYTSLHTSFHISEFHNHNRWPPILDNLMKLNIQNLLIEIRQEGNFNIYQLDEIENSFKNPIDVFNRFVNYGNCQELWLRFCN